MTFASFIRESNLIEGIDREPTKAEIVAHQRLLCLTKLSILPVCEFQNVLAPGKPLRVDVGMNVRVGDYVAPPGGPGISKRLATILRKTHDGESPWKVHVAFERLHPFMDGNGRTGRAIWAWHMIALRRDPFALPFLHRFYYQTLEASP